MENMVVADCAATAEALVESELFGHEKGAFTGAYSARLGLIARAHGTTLFLDEVDSMSWRMQSALLRALESGEYRPVGGSKTRTARFRLIAATSPKLLEMVRRGEFREDLFYRISTLKIAIPPLRERPGDAIELAKVYARHHGAYLSRDAQDAIGEYRWPGNVRQLHHVLDVCGLYAGDGAITSRTLAQVIGGELAPSDGRDETGPVHLLAQAREILGGRNEFDAWEFAKIAGVSRRSAQRYLARLMRQGHIARLGAGRATRYRLQ